MKTRPIHENLDTSFVNLSALVRYLRRRQFIGIVKIELNGYDATITLTEDNQMKVYENDRLAGRVSEGDEALQRLLIRAREGGGTIHVYQFVEESFTVSSQPIIEKPIQVQLNTNGNYQNGNSSNGIYQNGKSAQTNMPLSKNGFNETDDILTLPSGPLQKTFADKAKETFDQPKPIAKPKQNDFIEPSKPKESLELPKPIEPKLQTNLPNFPFDLSNNFENKAKPTQLSNEDWLTLLQLTGELFGTVDKILANENLNFPVALRKAQAELSEDYPFLNVRNGVFVYSNGRISMQEKVNYKLFVASLNEILRRMFDKLASNQRFSECYRQSVQSILALIRQRKHYYEKFSITPQLEKILGV
jgi:hypothetical protein